MRCNNCRRSGVSPSSYCECCHAPLTEEDILGEILDPIKEAVAKILQEAKQ